MDLSRLDPLIQAKIHTWLGSAFDSLTHKNIEDLLKTHPEELIDAFYTDLSFGTGGVRALMGVGTNRLNIYTIRLITQALASYLMRLNMVSPLVVIGYDSRHHSLEFAEETAKVLAGNNIEVRLFPDIRPTPYTSFACRYLKASAAVMITASHNPKEYNVYKVYWSDGAQVVPPHDVGILEESHKNHSLSTVRLAPLSSSLIRKTDPSLDTAYLKAIEPLQLQKKDNREKGHLLKVIYTSLHGTGITMVPKALSSWGFTNIAYVEQQIIPDGNFPTVKFPNPEYPETLQLGTALLLAKEGDLLLASDPDADRLGVVCLHQKKGVILTGNEIASICTYYLCSTLKTQGTLTPKTTFISTIVSTRLIEAIATSFGAHYCDVLTGFKYIGEKIHQWESEASEYQFLFGAEESYGYLLGSVARDKDAIIASCLLSEIALHLKLQGKTLIDALHTIYKHYGVYREGQVSLSFASGKEGSEKIEALMHSLREKPLSELCGKKVLRRFDYLQKKEVDIAKNTVRPLTLPLSDVLIFTLEGGGRLIIRPSGTEPKIKIYASLFRKVEPDAVEQGLLLGDKELEQLLSSAKKELS